MRDDLRPAQRSGNATARWPRVIDDRRMLRSPCGTVAEASGEQGLVQQYRLLG